MTGTETETTAPVQFMRHPDLGTIVPVQDSAFRGVWQGKGFEAVSVEDAAAADDAAAPDPEQHDELDLHKQPDNALDLDTPPVLGRPIAPARP